MNLFLKALGTHKKESILAPLFKMAEALLDLIVPLIMADIIDRGVAGGDRQYVMARCGLLVAIGLFGLLISITAQFFAAKSAVGACTKIRHDLFERITRLGSAELDELGSGQLVTNMTSDINQIQNAINLTLRLLLRSPFIVFGAAIMAFRVSPRAAVVLLVTIPVLAAVVFGIMRITRPRYRAVQEHLDGISGILHENLTGVRVVRAFGRTRGEAARFRAGNAALEGAQEHVGWISALMSPLTLVIVNLSIVALLMRGGVSVQAGTLSQGSVIALVNYMTQILVELIKLANLIVQISRGLACADRVDAVLNRPEGEIRGSRAAALTGKMPAVEFRNVSFAYPGSRGDSLSGISFSVQQGETVGVIGGTGSGKSTLAALIPGFYTTERGQVLLGGADVRTLDPASVKRIVRTVPQRAQLFKGTIRSNLLMGDKEAADFELWDALGAAQAADFVREREGGLDAEVEQAGRNFSGGQKQRLTIARALLGSPEILILDDSASALDYATDAALRRAIRALSGSRTIFIISQRINSVREAERILVLDEGRLAGYGSHAELLESCEEYRAIAASQDEEKEGTA